MAVCWECNKTIRFFDAVGGRCPDCHFAARKREEEAREAAQEAAATSAADLQKQMDSFSRIILSTEGSPDLPVAERLDVISAEFAVGMGLLTDIFNAWRDVFGGRSKSYQNALKDARKVVLHELRREADSIGADAVLGVSLAYSEISGGGKSMMFLVASGTAVKLAAPR